MRAVAPASLFLLAVAVRALPFARFLGGDHVSFYGTDAYYHARRILWSAKNFPATLRFDPFINHPHGGEPIWPPLFDGAAALLVRLLAPEGDDEAAYRLLVWLPPLLGAATTLVAWAIARRHFGTPAAWATGLVLALLPAHFQSSQLGYVDHHAAVSLLATLLLGIGMGIAVRWGPQARAPAREIAQALGLGAVLAAGFLVWPGSLLYLALILLPLSAQLLALPPRAGARGAAELALANALALLLLAPTCIGHDWIRWGRFSPVVLSEFQVWLLALLALGFALVALRLRATRAPRAGGRLALEAPVLAIALVGISWAAIPEISTGIADAWAWFARAETFQAQVLQSRPLFSKGGSFDAGTALSNFGFLVFALPFVLAHAGVLAFRESPSAPRRLLLWWCTALVVATLFQMRFLETLAPALALVLGWSFSALLRALQARGIAPAAAAGLPAAAILALLWPGLRQTYAVDLANVRAARRGEPVALPLGEYRRHMLMDVARWIRENTESGGDYESASGTPRYGVLSHWADGHVIQHGAHRATVVNNFGDDIGVENFALATRYYLAPEPEASALLDRLGVRYVIFEHRRIPGRREFEPESVLARLYFQSGSASRRGFAGRGGNVREVPARLDALQRHRLVYESPPKHWEHPDLPGFKVYEHVRGARVAGLASPGSEVEARVALETPQGRRNEYLQRTVADGAGRYELRLPYATRGGPPAVVVAPAYRIASGSRSAPLVLEEEAVRDGGGVAGPDLRPSAEAPGPG